MLEKSGQADLFSVALHVGGHPRLSLNNVTYCLPPVHTNPRVIPSVIPDSAYSHRGRTFGAVGYVIEVSPEND